MSKGTTRRTVRVKDGLWDEAKDLADEFGDSISDIMREALVDYIESKRG